MDTLLNIHLKKWRNAQILELQKKTKDKVIVKQKVITPKITTPKKTQRDDDVETKNISMDDMMLARLELERTNFCIYKFLGREFFFQL